MASEAPRLDINDTASSGRQDRVASQESRTADQDEQVKDHKVVCSDKESWLHVSKKDDKWKPIIDPSEEDKRLMPPPPGCFLRPSPGLKPLA